MKIYCITIHDNHLEKIKKLGYLPVGLGENITSKGFITDSTNNNITKKNRYYGEYTFHYWLWKNKILKDFNNWVGFCQYRKFWLKDKVKLEANDISSLNKTVLQEIPEHLQQYESILGDPLFINQFRLSKFLKQNFAKMVKRPSLFFKKNLRNLRFHFDMMHGDGNLDKAINLLDGRDRADFDNFVNTEVSFNPHNMFICKSYTTLEKYYESVFPWLERCEKEFGFDLDGYGLQRIYGFLAERYMSFWFKKYTKFTTLPIGFKDLSEIN